MSIEAFLESKMTEDPSRRYLSLIDRSFRLLSLDDVLNNDLCSHCAALNICIIVTPHGQPHVESLRCLQRSAQECPLCNVFYLSVSLGFDERTNLDDRSNNGSLVCRVQLLSGISVIYLAYSHNPAVSLCNSGVNLRVFTAEGMASPRRLLG
jgi:hypothetical protein